MMRVEYSYLWCCVGHDNRSLDSLSLGCKCDGLCMVSTRMCDDAFLFLLRTQLKYGVGRATNLEGADLFLAHQMMRLLRFQGR